MKRERIPRVLVFAPRMLGAEEPKPTGVRDQAARPHPSLGKLRVGAQNMRATDALQMPKQQHPLQGPLKSLLLSAFLNAREPYIDQPPVPGPMQGTRNLAHAREERTALVGIRDDTADETQQEQHREEACAAGSIGKDSRGRWPLCRPRIEEEGGEEACSSQRVSKYKTGMAV